jgi:predicted Zn finger-like uncharacterized protein
MRVSCPGCQTEYDVPDAALAGRTRTLRCAKCGHQWAAPSLDANAILAEPPPEPPGTRPLRALPEPAPERPRSIFSDLQNPAPEPPPPAAWPVASAPPAPPPFTPPALPPLPPLPPVYASPAPPAAAPIAEIPAPVPRWDLPAPSPDDALARREQAERDNFAALIEASRQNVLNDESPAKGSASRKPVNPWLVSILILAVAIALIWLERANIMKAWPPSARVLGNLGIVWVNISETVRTLLKL